jgi:Peptidase of plants and bacteria
MRYRFRPYVVLPVCLMLLGASACSGVNAQTRQKAAVVDYDCTDAPDLKDWVEKELKPAVDKWYPIILADLPSEAFAPPMHFDIKIDNGYKGVAATAGTHVMVSPDWVRSQRARGPVNEAVGSVIHELVHVAQQYGRLGRRNPMPGWLTEGIADYIRWWKFEPASVRRPVRAVKRDGTPTSYTDAYQTTAAFLEFVAKNYDHEIVVKLNAAGRDATYSQDLWKDYTGKSVDELWDLFVQTLK